MPRRPVRASARRARSASRSSLLRTSVVPGHSCGAASSVRRPRTAPGSGGREGGGQEDPPPDRPSATQPRDGVMASRRATRLTPGSRRSGRTRRRPPPFAGPTLRTGCTGSISLSACCACAAGPGRRAATARSTTTGRPPRARPRSRARRARPARSGGSAPVPRRGRSTASCCRDGDQHPPARTQHPRGLARDRVVVLDVLPDVGRHDEVERGVRKGQPGGVTPDHVEAAEAAIWAARGSTQALTDQPWSRSTPCCRRLRNRRRAPGPGPAAAVGAPSPVVRRTTSAAARAPPTGDLLVVHAATLIRAD